MVPLYDIEKKLYRSSLGGSAEQGLSDPHGSRPQCAEVALFGSLFHSPIVLGKKELCSVFLV